MAATLSPMMVLSSPGASSTPLDEQYLVKFPAIQKEEAEKPVHREVMSASLDNPYPADSPASQQQEAEKPADREIVSKSLEKSHPADSPTSQQKEAEKPTDREVISTSLDKMYSADSPPCQQQEAEKPVDHEIASKSLDKAYPVDPLASQQQEAKKSAAPEPCRTHQSSRPKESNKVRIPDMFVSFLALKPNLNPHYEVIKKESEQWNKQYETISYCLLPDGVYLDRALTLVVDFSTGLKRSIRHDLVQTFRTLQPAGAQKLGQMNIELSAIGPFG